MSDEYRTDDPEREPGEFLDPGKMLDCVGTRVMLVIIPMEEIEVGTLAMPAMTVQFRTTPCGEEGPVEEHKPIIMSQPAFMHLTTKMLECMISVDPEMAKACLLQAARDHNEAMLNQANPGRANAEFN